MCRIGCRGCGRRRWSGGYEDANSFLDICKSDDCSLETAIDSYEAFYCKALLTSQCFN